MVEKKTERTRKKPEKNGMCTNCQKFDEMKSVHFL